MNRKRLTNLIGAGTMATLIVAAGLAFGGNPFGNAAGATTEATVTSAVVASEDPLAAENAQLRAALTTMQQRELVYQDRLNEANTLLSQQTTNSGSNGAAYGDDDDDEYEAHEHEHERDEYAYEGGYDD